MKFRGCLRFLLVLCTWLPGCQSKAVNLTARLVYTGGGGNIDAINLVTAESTRLYEKRAISINALTRINANKFLFDECPLVSQCVLQEFDLRTRSVRPVRAGSMPTYVAQSNSLFY